MTSTSPTSETPAPPQGVPGRSGNNNNKLGKNQYKDRPLPDDPHVAELLTTYHRNGINDRREVSRLLLEEHGITLSESSISRRKRKLGLRASHITTQELSDTVKVQLILDQMAKDPSGKLGPRTVKQGIFKDTGIQLTRDYIREEMKKLDPVSWSTRGPKHVREKRQQLQNSLGEQNATGSVSSLQPSASPSNANPIVSAHSGPHVNHTETQPIAGPSHPPSHPHHATGSVLQSQHISFASHGNHHIPVNPPHQNLSSTYHAQIVQQPSEDAHMHMDDGDDDEDTGVPQSGQYENHFQAPYQPPPHVVPTPANNHPHPQPHTHTQYHVLNVNAPSGPHPPPTSPPVTAVIGLLQEATPKMEALTRFLNVVDTENVTLDAEAYHAIVQGMESAALLERQLSRIISRTHQQYRRS